MATSESRAEQLQDVNAAEIVARWRMPEQNRGPRVSLLLPHGCGLTMNLFNQNLGVVEVGTVRVNPGLRGAGIGERLCRSLGALSHKYGYRTLCASVSSQYSLDILGRVLDQEGLAFFGRDRVTGRQEGLPIDFSEARNFLELAEGFETDLEHRDIAIETVGELVSLDLANGELPREQAPESFDWSLVKARV